MRPNRPHIPSFIQFSKSKDTKQTTHPNFGRICRRASRFRNRRLSPLPPNHTTASLRRVVFGEPVFRETRQNPQDENAPTVAFSSYFPIFQQK
jgi:hypothetical protein